MFKFLKRKKKAEAADARKSLPTPVLKPSLRSLEQRLMFDGAAAATTAEVASETVAQEQAEEAVTAESTQDSTASEPTDDQNLLQALSSFMPNESRTEIVFVDPTVPNYQELLGGMDANVEVILLDATRDGVAQIAETLAGRTGIDAIHLISHGDAGMLQLGTGTLTTESMTGQYADELGTIQQALSEQADILVYGCDFAEGDAGQAAVTRLAGLTGADVQASDDATGAASLGGDWTLETQTGAIETHIAVTDALQMDWVGLLDISTGLIGNWTFDTDANDSSGNNYNGTLTNGAAIDTTDATDIVGGAKLSLDGVNDYVDLSAHSVDLAGFTQGTIAGWIKTTSTFETIFSISDTADTGSSVALFIGASGYLTYEVRENGVLQLAVYRSSATINDGNWHHVAVTVGTSGNSLYVDGVLATAGQLTYDAGDATTQGFFSSVTSLDSMAIGRDQGSGGGTWYTTGLIDDVRVYDRVLTGGDVAQLYTTSNDAPTITNLSGDSVSYSEGAGAVVIEQGANVLVADIDSSNFDTGTLTISIPSGGDSAEDVLSIRNQGTGAGQIGVSGSNVTYGGVTIGTFTGGSNGTSLVITLNSSADATTVTALIKNITYENTDAAAPTVGARTVRYVLTDGDGGTSANYDTTVTVSAVNDAPVLALGATNLLTNGSFESGGTGWTGNSGVEATTRPGDYGIPAPPDGTGFLEVESGNAPAGTESYVEQTFTTVVGQTYVVSLSAITRMDVNVQDRGAFSINGVEIGEFTTGTSWQDYAVSFTATSTSSTLQIISKGSLSGGAPLAGDAGGLLIDHVQVVAVQTAATYTEGGAPVVLAGTARVFDAELSALNTFNGATLTLARNGGANAEDVFSGSGTLSLTSGNVVVSGTTIGTYTNSGGTLAVTFNGNATQALVNSAMQQIAYSNSSDAPPASAQINWTISDGNSSSQGTGGALTATGSTTITITAVNDAPTDLSMTTVVDDMATHPITTIVSQTGSQLTTATLSSGNSVNVYLSGSDVYAQIYDPQGNPLGSAVRVLGDSDPDIGPVSNPVVAALPTGGFIVVLQAQGYLNSGDWGTVIVGRAYDDGGQLINVLPGHDSTGAMIISNTSAGNAYQGNPTVDVAGDGTITVSWNNTTAGLLQQRQFHILGPTVAENAAAGTVVATLQGVDRDAGDTLTYSIVGGDSNFEIVGTQLRVKAGAALDYETATSHTLTLRVTDSGGLTRDEVVTIGVTNTNDAPTLTNLSGDSLSYSEGAGAVVIEQGANVLVADVDSLNFDTGTLTISIPFGGDSAEDVLSIRNQGTGAGQIGVSGNTVSYGGVTIGTFTGGSNGTSLVITLNSSATPTAVTALIKNITYENMDAAAPTTGARTVRYVLTDGDGGTSANYDTTVTVTAVNDAPTFGVGDGQATTSFGAGWEFGKETILQPDGKILVAGYSDSGGSDDFSLARYNVDGTLDTSFGGGDGIALAGIVGRAETAVLQADGKIVLSGYTTNGGYQVCLVRFNTNGTLDTSFGGGDGIASSGVFGSAKDIGLQTDGKFLVAADLSNNNFNLMRFNSDGSLDTSFGGGSGYVSTDLAGGNDRADSLTIQSDGKVILAGFGSNGTSFDFALVRYNTDGSLDTSFNGTGKVLTDFGGNSSDTGNEVRVQADGKIVVAGWSDTGGTNDFAIARYNANGTLDAGFGTGGKVTINLGGSDLAEGLTIQADGKLLVTGTAGINGNDFGLVRLNTDGSLDTTFSGDGIVTTDYTASSDDRAYSVVVQSDGRIVVSGTSKVGALGDYNYALTRYSSTGALDTTLDPVNTLDGAPAYTEGGSPVVLDADVSIFDAELSTLNNFSGATLTLARNGGANPEDLFSATGTLSLSSGNLIVSGTTIGTYSNSGGTLAFTFNSNATQTLVNSAIRQITYSNSSDAPPASAQINWTFSDGNSGSQGSGGALTATGSTIVTITGVNDAPTLTNLSGDSLAYSEGAGAVVIEQGANALVTDIDSSNFDTGTLTISIPSGGDSAEDVLSIRNQGTGAGQIGVSGSSVTYDGVTIGTFTGGSNGTSLVITLNSSATPTAVTALIKNITYENTDTAAPTTGARTVRYVLTDGDGGTSANYDTTVMVTAVNDAPVLADSGLTFTVLEDAGAPVNGTAVGAAISAFTGSVTDPDGAVAKGLAIISSTETNGTWYYTTDAGATWLTVGAVSDSASLLLADTAGTRLYFAPNSNYTGNVFPGLIVRAWDQSSGVVGTKVDTSVQGGSTAFSLVGDTIDPTVIAMNDPPAFSNLDGTPTFTEGGAAVVLDSNVTFTDPELSALNGGAGDYFGSSILLERNGGPNANDVFSATGNLSPLIEGTSLVLSGVTIGYVTTNSGGTLLITFDHNATSARVNEAVQSIAYSNTSEAPSSPVVINWASGDGNDGSQGTGGVLGATGSTTVTIAGVNDVPVNTVPGVQAVVEDTSLALSGISVNDVDGNLSTVQLAVGNGTLDVTLSGGATISAGASGTTTVTLAGTQTQINAALATLNYQGVLNFTGSDTLTVTSTDGNGVTDVDTVAITVTPVNDMPTDLVLSANTVAENAANGTVVGTISGTDPDVGDTRAYSLTDSAGGRFAINSSTGQITVADGTLLNYDSAASHNVTVRVTDSGGLTYDEVFSIALTNVNEAPTAITLSGSTVAENSANGTVVGTASAVDADAGDSHTYQLLANAGGRFAIDPATGVISVADGTLLDFETATSHAITIRATDAGGLTHDLTVTIAVADVNETGVETTMPGSLLPGPQPSPIVSPTPSTTGNPSPTAPADGMLPPSGSSGSVSPSGSSHSSIPRPIPHAWAAPPQAVAPGRVPEGEKPVVHEAERGMVAWTVVEPVLNLLHESADYLRHLAQSPEIPVRLSEMIVRELDEMTDFLDHAMEGRQDEETLAAATAASVSVVLSAGYLVWALRGGWLMASLLATMPAWHSFDPLPVLVRAKEDRRGDATPDDPQGRTEEQRREDARVDEVFGSEEGRAA